MENGDETLAHPTAAAAEKAAPNGGVAEEEAPVTVTAAKSYAAVAAVAANAEIEDLRAAKLDLEEKLAAAERQNKELAMEAHRLEGIFCQARDDVATAEHSVTVSEEKVAVLEANIKRLEHLIMVEKADRDADRRNALLLASELEAVRQVKLKLEKEIEALKAAAAAAAAVTAVEREAAPASKTPKDAEVAWKGMAAAAAGGAAATAAFVLIYLRLKKR